MNYKIVSSFIVFVVSSLGLAAFILLKVPALVSLPEVVVKKKKLGPRIKRQIESLSPSKNFSLNIFLQKILTKVRIISLKTDNKTFSWLQKLKDNTQQRKIREDGDYWNKVKKATKK